MPRRTNAPLPSGTATLLSNSSSSSSSSAAIPATFTDGLPLPKLFVFDLDYTLWPFWVDTHVTPPLKPSNTKPLGRSVRDRYGEGYAFYPDVPGILGACRARGVKVAAASRTSAPDLAGQMLSLLSVWDVRLPAASSSSADADADANAEENGEADSSESAKKKTDEKEVKGRPAKTYFDNMQIYPGSKIRHFERIRKAMGIEYEDMLFFDDEGRNRDVEREHGVLFVLVTDGVDRGVIDRGVERWRRMRGLGRREGESADAGRTEL